MTSNLKIHAQAPVDGGPPLTDMEMLEYARRAVRHYRSALHQPAWLHSQDDDVVGDVIEACLRARRSDVVVCAAYVQAVARNLVTRDRDLCSADARALRLLKAEIHKLEQDQGSQVTPAQTDDLASMIIHNWNGGSRRPSATFHQRRKMLSLDWLQGLGFERTTESTDDSWADDDASSRVYELLDQVQDAHGKAEFCEIRRSTWNAIAQLSGAPQVQYHVSKNKVTGARTTILRHERGAKTALHVAMDEAKDGKDTALTQALFAPFYKICPDGQVRVVRVLRKHPVHDVDLWLSALASAGTSTLHPPRAA